MLTYGLPSTIAVALIFGAWLSLWQFAALPILIVVAWRLLRFNVPPEDRIEQRLAANGADCGQLIGWSGLMCVLLVLIAFDLIGLENATAFWTLSVVAMATLLPLLFACYKSDKQRRVADQLAAE